MDRRLTFPVFGNAPDEYDRRHIDDISRKLNQFMTLVRSPGEGRQTRLVITDLTENDYGLEPGTLFQVEGTVKVSVPNRPHPAGVSATGYVGSTSITIV